MSLRAQLQAVAGSTKPLLAATLNADNLHDGSRCNTVAWVPKSDSSQFLAAHASGTILVYKKASTVVSARRGSVNVCKSTVVTISTLLYLVEHMVVLSTAYLRLLYHASMHVHE